MKSMASLLNPWLKDLESYEAGKSFEEVMGDYGLKESDILKLASNETTLGTSPKAIKAAAEAVNKSHFYEEAYSQWFRKYLENKFKEEGIDTGVVVGNGMDSIIETLAKLFLDQDSSIVISSPTFIYYKLAADWAGAELIDTGRDANNFSIDSEKILKSVKENTKIVFICSPNNPTGNLTSLEEIEYLAKNLNCLLFVDHAYIEFTDRSQDAKKIIEKYPNLVIGYTMSKAYALAGYRVGYGLMSKELRDKCLQVMAPFLNTRPSLAAAKAALEDKDHLNKVVHNNEIGKSFYYHELPKLGFEFTPTDANYILIKHPELTADELCLALLKTGIIVRNMKSVCPHSVRLTIGTDAENKRVLKALAELLK